MNSTRTHVSLITVALLAAATALPAQRVEEQRNERLRNYGKDLAGAAVLGVLWAGVMQVQKSPPQWSNDLHGFGNRVASNIGASAITVTVDDGLGALMHRPTHYVPCRCSGLGKRIGSGLMGTITDRLEDGRRVPAIPRIAGAYAGSFAQATWWPDSDDRVRLGLVNGTVSLLVGAAVNVFHEVRAGDK